MLDFLKERYFRKNEKGYFITGFNNNTNKLIVFDYGDDNETKFDYEGSLFKTRIEVNIDYYDDWKEKIFKKLVTDGKVDIHILSTVSDDNWNLEIFRHKTLINNHEFDDNLIITNYIIYCNGEVKGDILSKQDLYYLGCLKDEEKMFYNWIEEQISEVQEFNNTSCWDTFNAIVTSTAFITDQELKLLYKLFNQKFEK